jgi:hypothetical protein
MDIALFGLNTRIMFRNLDGFPKSAISKGGDITVPAAAIHRASRTSFRSAPV